MTTILGEHTRLFRPEKPQAHYVPPQAFKPPRATRPRTHKITPEEFTNILLNQRRKLFNLLAKSPMELERSPL